MIQTLGSILVLISAVLADACVIYYQVRARWWKTPYGRHLFSFMAVIAVCLNLGFVRFLLGDSPIFQVIRLVAFVGVPWVLGWRLVILVKAQREERKRRLEAER